MARKTPIARPFTSALGALLCLATACGPDSAELAKDGSAPLREFLSAAEFAAPGGDATGLCLSGAADLDFTTAGQELGFAFAAQVGESVAAETTGRADFDTVLLLYGPDDGSGYYGRLPVATDDDGGEGRLSRLAYEIKETGAYLLLVTTWKGRFQGPTTLHVAVGGAAGCTPAAAWTGDPEVCCVLTDAVGEPARVAGLTASLCTSVGGRATALDTCGAPPDRLCCVRWGEDGRAAEWGWTATADECVAG